MLPPSLSSINWPVLLAGRSSDPQPKPKAAPAGYVDRLSGREPVDSSAQRILKLVKYRAARLMTSPTSAMELRPSVWQAVDILVSKICFVFYFGRGLEVEREVQPWEHSEGGRVLAYMK